jgi:CheY-like chemotaxis protein
MKRNEMIRVLCANSDSGAGEGFASVLDREPDMLLVGETENGEKAVELFRLRRPHVTLIDLTIPSHGGIDAIRSIRAEAPYARIVGLARSDAIRRSTGRSRPASERKGAHGGRPGDSDCSFRGTAGPSGDRPETAGTLSGAGPDAARSPGSPACLSGAKQSGNQR